MRTIRLYRRMPADIPHGFKHAKALSVGPVQVVSSIISIVLVPMVAQTLVSRRSWQS